MRPAFFRRLIRLTKTDIHILFIVHEVNPTTQSIYLNMQFIHEYQYCLELLTGGYSMQCYNSQDKLPTYDKRHITVEKKKKTIQVTKLNMLLKLHRKEKQMNSLLSTPTR